MAATAAMGLTLLVGPGAGSASAEPSANDWYRLRVCESGNNYAINTGNGYYGAYQFDLSTWRSVGGTGRPDQASPAVQDALALKLWYSRGWSPWSCARIVGLTGSPPAGGQPAAPVVLAAPVGTIDSVTTDAAAATITVNGWAFDPNSSSSAVFVHVYVNGVGYPLGSGGSRADVNAAFRISGDHGIANTVPARRGSNDVCVYAIGVNAGNNALLGCRTVQVPYAPVGSLDVARFAGNGSAVVAGWTLDANDPGRSIPAHVYVNGVGTAVTADGARGDVNQVTGLPGNHGFLAQVGARPGTNTVCAFGIGLAVNTQLSCTTFQAPQAPFGSLDVVSLAGDRATVAGWAIDPADPDASIPVHLYVSGVGYVDRADGGRDDVNRMFSTGGAHGFTDSIPMKPGEQVCAFGIGTAGFNTLLGCGTA
ncbi:putative membrane protein [Nakamurella flavida]|uniref:transglycosylase family protein n=1 Tax=Nakamurella flavida TaxID=363630 RepID=UPI00278A3D6C|nr:transglycosylase family protein [Nakamurella flavida]MDP9779545.1 putative membrane protein [Nakamurella flavida]